MARCPQTLLWKTSLWQALTRGRQATSHLKSTCPQHVKKWNCANGAQFSAQQSGAVLRQTPCCQNRTHQKQESPGGTRWAPLKEKARHETWRQLTTTWQLPRCGLCGWLEACAQRLKDTLFGAKLAAKG